MFSKDSYLMEQSLRIYVQKAKLPYVCMLWDELKMKERFLS